MTEWCNTTHAGLSDNGWCNRTGWGPKANPGNPVETMTSDGSYGERMNPPIKLSADEESPDKTIG